MKILGIFGKKLELLNYFKSSINTLGGSIVFDDGFNFQRDQNGSYIIFTGNFYQKDLFLSAMDLDWENHSNDFVDMRILKYLILYDEFSLLRDLYAEFLGLYIDDNRILILSDIRSSIPIFYTVTNDDSFLFSNSPELLSELYEKEIDSSKKNTFRQKDMQILSKGMVLEFNKGKIKKYKYNETSFLRDNSKISKKEIIYEITRLLIRSIELITRDLEEIIINCDSFESIICAFLLPFERINLTLISVYEEYEDILRLLKKYYDNRIKILGSCNERAYDIIFTDFSLKGHSLLFKNIKNSDKLSVDIKRDKILDLIDWTLEEKASHDRILRNPFQEPFFKEFLRTLDPSIILNNQVFDYIAQSNLIKKMLKRKNIKRLMKLK